jgi:DNA-binding NtrC family response regulator
MAELVIVDDEQALLRSLQLELNRVGHRCHAFETAEQALHHFEEFVPDLAFVDIRLPDMDGLQLIRKIKSEGHEFPIVVMTGFASISNAVAAMREGAIDYIEKPIDLEQLKLVIDRNLANVQLRGRLELLERTRQTHQEIDLIGKDENLLRLIEVARRIAAPDVARSADLPTILLLGETGTGKDLFARFIHQNSPTASEPFVQLNCAALPRELIESELFGHEKGAFTDAKGTKRGLMEIAGHGTLFLDEIGELSVDLQAKLLSALENRQFRRIGGTRNRTLTARFIAATNADLVTRIREGTFRDDLFYRLNVFTFSLPPLRERPGDIELLASHFLVKFARKYHRPVPELSQDALRRLKEYHWPGNVRELSHVIENVTLLSDTGTIRAHHLGLSSTGVQTTETSDGVCELRFNLNDPATTLATVERQLIEHALRYTAGNVSESAKLLGLSRGALRRRLENIPSPQ